MGIDPSHSRAGRWESPLLAAALGVVLAYVGTLWLVLMLGFEVAFGRLVFRASWKRLAADFAFREGGLLSLGMLVLFLAPLLAAAGRGLL